MKLTPVGKIIAFIVVVGVAVGVARFTGLLGKLAPGAKDKESVTPGKATLPAVEGESNVVPVSGGNVSLPGSEAGCTDKPEVRLLGYAWNAQMGELFAIGGAQATKGSLMCQHGVNMKFERQDDNGKLTEALVSFATELSQGNAQPTKGAHFVQIMGDGSAVFLKGLNDALKRLGPEYRAKVIGAVGFSRGEDKFMGPPEWKANPAACRGGLVAGVIRDGDWNIAQKWLGDNGLRTNPDEKTWDPDALNWVNASDYLDAPQKYIAGYAEDRPVVRNGKRTGETKKVTVNAVVTWTPGDVNVAEQKGGLVSLASTREYASQMPSVVIGIDKWCKANRSIVEGMLMAAAEGGAAVRSDPKALHRAAEISAAVYHDQGSDADYWEKYYKGTQQLDKQGLTVELGGSQSDTLADMLLTFGLVPGSANLFAATYTVFGDIAKQQYPELVPSYAPVSQILDTSYLQALAGKASSVAKVKEQIQQAKPTFVASKAPLKHVVSSRSWNIHFQSGKAAFTPDAQKDLDRLRRDLLVASGTRVEVHGHTDNQGNPDANMQLSEARAFAVKKWLQKQFPVNFPEGRVQVYAHGQTMPMQPNTSDTGRAANRRVVVVLGTS